MHALTLLAGFDSAWTAHTTGALSAVLLGRDGSLAELTPTPLLATFAQATGLLEQWQHAHRPARTLIFLDQPTIVPNLSGHRPVDRLLCSPVAARRGAIQPAFTGRADMFGPAAPLWPFLHRFGLGQLPAAAAGGQLSGAAEPWGVIETYPVLTLIALGWLLHDPARLRGRLPKYNPARARTFLLGDWQYVCNKASGALLALGCPQLAASLAQLSCLSVPRKPHQDQLDSALCLLAALHVALGLPALLVGEQATGWLAVPYSAVLGAELSARCLSMGLDPAAWLQQTKEPASSMF
jgi:predicted RNase H-like nuclease